MLQPIVHKDAREAIRDGNMTVSSTGHVHIVAYWQGKGWIVYNPLDGFQQSDIEPEFLCLGLGRVPLPIGEHAVDVLFSAIRAEERDLTAGKPTG